MKMICDVPDEVIKCIKDGTWCGSSVAEKMIANGIPLSSSENPNKWIPLKTRPMTDEESTFYRDWAEYGAELFDCHLPDDGQEVLISVCGGVEVDTFVQDANDGCYFEGRDIDDVDAWMPLPEPYKQEVEE